MMLALLLIFGCSKEKPESPAQLPGQAWLRDMEARVETHISDPALKAQLMALIHEEEMVLKDLHRAAVQFYKDLKKVDRDYDATEDDFRKIFSDYNRKRKELRERSIDFRFKMHALVPPDQWDDIADISKRKGLFKEAWQYPTLEYIEGGE